MKNNRSNDNQDQCDSNAHARPLLFLVIPAGYRFCFQA